MSGTKDRRRKLLKQSPPVLNGIDYVGIANAERTALEVHFLNAAPLAHMFIAASITGGQSIPSVPVTSLVWSTGTANRPVLTVNVAAPGDSSIYTLSLTSHRLDPFFSHARFSFVAGDATTLDCETPAAMSQAPAADIPPIDYLAKDFLSFRKALSDFSTLKYPAWQERSEADFGIMFMEALCALGDDLSYQQDRIAAEAYLDTATERLSIIRHARLVDYEPTPALASNVLLQFTVSTDTTSIPPGLAVSATGPDGTAIDFETGTGLADTQQYPASAKWNAITPYWWDDSARVLPAGATEMWVQLHDLNLNQPGMSLLLDTMPADAALPNIRETIQIKSATEQTDPLYDDAPVTQIVFQNPTTAQHDLFHVTTVRGNLVPVIVTTVKGNLVPATQGLRHVESFAIGSGPVSMPSAIVRTGPNQTTQYLYTLGNAPLTWLATSNDPSVTQAPEIQLTQQLLPPNGAVSSWTWQRSLLDAAAFESAFTIDPVRYTQLPPELADGTVQFDYDGSNGDTVRFGDGDFGEIPAANSTFTVTYRAGGGAIGNVAADSITAIVSTGPLGTLASAVTNPFAATGGADAEASDSVRRLAPYAFQSARFNALLPADYAAAAGSLPWVKRAGCTVRHTGSWLTAFTAAEPTATEVPTDDQMRELTALLGRYRMAGSESYALAPSYVSLDLQITARANPGAFNANVAAAILQALGTGTFPDGSTGFFAHGNFTFGQSLERSALEAAIQNAQGAAGVTCIRYRRSGSKAAYIAMTDQVKVGVDQIIRVDNDPSRPDAGSISVTVTGGR